MKQPNYNTTPINNDNSIRSSRGSINSTELINDTKKSISKSRGFPNRSSFYRLVEACKRKDLILIDSILNDKPNLINERDSHNRTLLHYSVISLLDPSYVIETNSIDIYNKRCIECFNYLTNRCDSKLWSQQDSDGLNILHLAVISSNEPIVRHIIYDHQNSIKYSLVNTLDNENHSPLHWAVITNNLECVRLLVESAGISLVQEPDLNGATPLHYATQASDYPKYRQQLRRMLANFGTVSSIHQRQSIDSIAGESNQQLPECSGNKSISSRQDSLDNEQSQQSRDNFKVLEYLVKLPRVNLECLDKDFRTPLLWAASSGSHEAILLLVANGANLMSYDINHLSALHCAASHGYTDCVECLLNLSDSFSENNSNYPNSARLVNQLDHLNCTPLFYAVLSGNLDCIEIILDHGAQVSWQDSKGRTVAHFAALKGQLNTLKLLAERGANLWLANKLGDLPLHYAIKSGRQQVVKWLLDHSPYEHAVNAINNFGRAPIHLAVLKNNAPLTEYLIQSGANLNQLVRVKEKAAGSLKRSNEVVPSVNETATIFARNNNYRYETALDVAQRLNHSSCMRLLIANHALPAAQVIANRAKVEHVGLANSSSLFEIQSVDRPSPIGFETSSSSPSISNATETATTPQAPVAGSSIAGNQATSTSQIAAKIPKLSRPSPEALPQTDSTRTSSMSQNSLTSIRGTQRPGEYRGSYAESPGCKLGASTHARDANKSNGHQSPHEELHKPYIGGVSYSNELIDASIKCKVYNGGQSARPNQRQLAHYRSYPPDAPRSKSMDCRQSCSAAVQSSCQTNREIVTKVNVYTSPVAHCIHSNCLACSDSKSSDLCRMGKLRDQRQSQVHSQSDTDEPTSEEGIAESELESLTGENRLPIISPGQSGGSLVFGAGRFGQSTALLRHLPPSQGCEQHLPVILSEQERSTSNTSNEQSPKSKSGHFAPTATPDFQFQTSSAAEEPRFDRVQRARPTHRIDNYRDRIKSPVAEYIQAPVSRSDSFEASQRASRLQTRLKQPPLRQPDFSQVKAKVDSHLDPELDAALKSKSLTNISADSQAGSRSVSRQTIIKGRQSSLEGLELATKVEKSIRKYRQETKLFEELQNLKRSQIRSGRANEALLVKRLVEHFRNEYLIEEVIALDQYHGPYTYKAYELYLYDQLRKLSQSNCSKLDRLGEEQQSSTMFEPSPSNLNRNYSEEDMKAELELRRVIGSGESGDEADLSPEHTKMFPNLPLVEREVIEHTNGKAHKDEKMIEDENISEIIQEDKRANRRTSASSAGSSRRSSAEIVLVDAPLRINTEELLRRESESMSNSIIFDALGNVSRNVSPELDNGNNQDDEMTLSSEAIKEQELQKKDKEEAKVEQAEEDVTSEINEKKADSEANLAKLGRRRSIVNIGNKMEVIYHDVGIEIDRVSDKNDDDDDDDECECETKKILSIDNEPTEKQQSDLIDSETKLKDENVKLENVTEEDEIASKSSQDEIVEDMNQEKSEILEGSQSSTNLDEDLTNRLDSDSSRVDRRASSPELDGKSDHQKGRVEKRNSYDHSESNQRRKIFNGYDLDKMRGRLERKTEKLSSTEEDLSKTELEKKKSEQEGESSSPEKPKLRKSKKTFRRNLRRSRLPEGKYIVSVLLEDIKQRWNTIKQTEIKRKRQLETKNNSLLVDFGQKETKSTQIKLTKSQPNLKDQQESRDDLTFSNFILWYEINKGARCLYPSMDSESQKLKLNWCHRRAIRIVDVRLLKRTLSFPESLIYSNDLMKRFNILKL